MPFVSVTRLRLRSVRFLPKFVVYTLGANRQVARSAGFLGGRLQADRRWTFWTLTCWDSQQDMRAYITTGDHMRAMPHLLEWCDEASLAHWVQPDAALPSWADAEDRMRREGRPSKVFHPSPHHADLSFARARPYGGGPIEPAEPKP
jgi:hypothetical protein